MRALLGLLFAPFWVHFLLAGAVVGLGYYVQETSRAGYVEKQRIAERPAPEVVAISDFKSDAPYFMPVEVNVRAQVAIEHNVNLIETKNGKTVRERSMYILTAPDAAADSKIAYGAVILSPDDVDDFAQWATIKMMLGGEEGGLGPIMTFDGLRDNPSDKSHIKKALGEQGFIAAPDFLYIEPFLEGRVAGLAITDADTPIGVGIFLKIASVFVLIGVVKFVMGRLKRGRGVPAKQPAAPMPQMARAAPKPSDPASFPVTATPATSSNDFIGALARKKLEPAPDVAPAIVSSRSLSDRFGGGFGGFAKKMGVMGLGLVAYLVMMNLTPGMQPFSVAGGKPAEIVMVQIAPATPAASDMGVSKMQGTGAKALMAPAQAPAQAPAAAPEPARAGMFAWLQAQFAQLPVILAGLKAKFAAPPLWLMVSVLGAAILFPAVMLLSRVSFGRAKTPDFDPFERLMQRRLAEKAREQNMGQGLQRA